MKLAFPQHAELSTSLSMRRPCLPHAVSARGKQVSACGNGPPHAEHESPHAETFLRTAVSACPPHAEHRSPHAETILRTRNTDLRMRRRSSARGTRCGDVPLHAEHRSPHAEHESPHTENDSPHAEAHVMRKTMKKCRSRLP